MNRHFAHFSAIRVGGLVAGLAAVGLTVAGCGSLPGYGEQAGSTKAAAKTSGTVSLSVASTSLGKVLVGNEDMTLYMWKMDDGTQSACEDDCAVAWPPVTTDSPPDLGSGVDAGLVGSTFRSDGSSQLTYDGHPLYYFKKDTESGDVKGQGSKGFGAAWWVMSGSGKVITATAPVETSDDSSAEDLGSDDSGAVVEEPTTKATKKATAKKTTAPKTTAPKTTAPKTDTTVDSGAGDGYDYGY